MLREKLELLHASLPEYVKTKQKLFFFGGFGLITFLIIVFIAVKSSANSKERQRKEDEALPVEKRIKIDSGGSSLNPQEIWVDRLEKQQALLNKRFELIEKLVVDLTKGRIAPAHPMGFTPNERADSSLSEDQPPLNSGTSFNRLDPSGVMKTAEMGNFAAHRPSSSGYDLDPSSSQNAPLPIKMQRITFSLDPLASKKIKKSIDTRLCTKENIRPNLLSLNITVELIQIESPSLPTEKYHPDYTDYLLKKSAFIEKNTDFLGSKIQCLNYYYDSCILVTSLYCLFS
jgi:hypothetical protein